MSVFQPCVSSHRDVRGKNVESNELCILRLDYSAQRGLNKVLSHFCMNNKVWINFNTEIYPLGHSIYNNKTVQMAQWF